MTLSFGALPSGVAAGTYPSTTVLIDDLDTSGGGGAEARRWLVSFDLPAYTVREGETATITVNVSPKAPLDLVIPLVADPENADYFELPARTVTIARGAASASFELTATEDDDSDDKTLTLSFGALPVIASRGRVRMTKVTIVDPDPASLTVAFERDAYQVQEGESVEVAVALSGAADRDLAIPLVTDPASGDFRLAETAVTVPRGERRGTLTFSARRDEDADDETVTLSFGMLPAGLTASIPRTTEVQVLDSALAVSFAAPTYSVEEGAEIAVEVPL